MEFVDPFKSDTDKFRKLLADDNGEVEYAEVIEESPDPKSILANGTVKGLPPSMFEAVKKRQAELELDKEKKAQVARMFNQLFTDLNTKYNLNISLDFNSFSNSLNYIIEPVNKKAMEYYLSEAYSRFRVVLYGQYLNAIAILSAQILDPAYLLSESMTYDQKLDTMQRLYEFMSTMNDIYKEVNIPDTDMKLEKLNTERRSTYDLNDPKIREFMQNLFNSVTDKEDK